MVNVSQDIIKSFNEGNKQTALIEVTAGSKTFTITDANIIQGGLKIDRYCVTNSKIEVGSAVASELSLKLRNYDGKFNDVSFEGAVLNVKIGIKLSSVLEGATLGKGILGRMILGSASSDQDVAYVPCGLFIVDTPPRKLSTISISALDYMVLFDREVNASALSFPIHVDALIQKICSICNVTLATDVSVLPNHYFSIGGLPDTNQKLTYRQLLQWCAQLTGTCAFMDGSGRLVLKWYEQTGVTITASERYSSDMLESDITITGFTCDDGKGNTYLSGTADYTIDLGDCGFLTNAYEGVLKELQAARGGFAYRPYSATIKSAPYLFPLDMIRYKDKDGVVHDTIVTNVTLALNCNTAISGAGETITSSSYTQSTSGVTSQQAATDRANLEKINQTATQTNQNKQDLTQFRTEYSSDLEKTNAAIEARVTKETYQTGMAGVSTRIGAAETKINQNAEAITLRATKEEVSAAKSDAISTAASDASTKANAAQSNAKAYTDAQLKITSESITSTVSKTYATQAALNSTNSNVSTAQNTADNALSGVNSLETRVSSAETQISQNSDEIVLRATKEEVSTAKSDAINSAAKDATSKANIAESNAKSYSDAQLKVTNEKIETKVSKGDIASTINQTAQSVQIEASKINLKGAVTTEDISAEGLNAKAIQAGTITATEIKADTITAGNIASGQIIRKLWQNASAGTESLNGRPLQFQMSTFPAQQIDLDFSELSQIQIVFKGNRFQSGKNDNKNCFSFSSILVPLFTGDDDETSSGNAVFYTASVPLPSARYRTDDSFYVTGYTFSFRSFQVQYGKNASGGGYLSIYFWDGAVQNQDGSVSYGTNYNDWCIPYRIYGMK